MKNTIGKILLLLLIFIPWIWMGISYEIIDSALSAMGAFVIVGILLFFIVTLIKKETENG